MKHVCAYLLAQMGGKSSPKAGDIETILGAVGAEADADSLSKLLSSLEGKDNATVEMKTPFGNFEFTGKF